MTGKSSAGLAQTPCPCGSGLRYGRCCGIWHEGERHLQAPTAEALMRSRYSAYVLDLTGYVADTWHPSTRPASLEPNPSGLKWLGLDVKRHVQIDATHATVEFVARSRLHGRAERMHEVSRFIKEADCWYYVDGKVG